MFESEKSNMHNQLLKQIQQGVKLKRVQTNDRSRPMLDGLRKFRRQLTIEEQMQKAEETIDDSISDDMDDIDAVRDDLQSTKQMLALELRNKEALERENKRLQVNRCSESFLSSVGKRPCGVIIFCDVFHRRGS